MRTTTLSSIALLTAFILPPIYAQNITTNATCPNFRSIDEVSSQSSTVNSTGSVPFTWNRQLAGTEDWGPWYLSVLVNDTVRGRHNISSSRNIEEQGFLSVSENVQNVGVCLYQFSVQNATSMGDGALGVGCAGVLDDTCTRYLREAMLNASARSGSAQRCPNAWTTEEEREKRDDACPQFGTIVWNSKEMNVSNATCTFPSLPGVDLPDGYINNGLGGSYSPYSEIGNFGNATTAYDLSVNQVVPFAVVAHLTDEESNVVHTEIQFVCVTPNITQEGSRVPEDNTPWKSAGASWKCASGLAITMAGLVGAVLAF